MKTALLKVPGLKIVYGHYKKYQFYSEQVMEILCDTTPLVEQISIDEAFLDVTDMPQKGAAIAAALQKRIRDETALPCSIGIASNKLVAKIANDWGKAHQKGTTPPNAITIIPPGEEAEFLAPLPVQSLWGVGPKTADKLAEVGITTIGALAETPPDTLEMLFGRFGPELGERARGIDDRPISLEHEVKSISNETTFARDLTDEVALREAFRRLADQVGQRLRKTSLAGTTIQVKLRWADFTTITRQTTLPFPTNLDREIYDTALQLFMENWTRGRPVRLIGVGVSPLGPPARQLGLWDDTPQKEASLLTAVDKLRERYGRDIIQRANRVRKNRQGHDDNEVSDQK